MENYCRKLGLQTPQISAAAQVKISEYDWPGNVRQLQNAMIYAVNTSQGNWIKPENLPEYIVLDTNQLKFDGIMNSNSTMRDVLCLETLEKAAIEAALRHANNCVPVAAEVLGISRSTLYRKLKEYNIEQT